ncbi:CHAT domain-containing protein [Phyllosticta capitalensis]|uniref:CHAT domain-containing protein n=1 Tax=Phyllosticta capitalensis TaxID=121624 RepID=A0ABR1YFE3_9PEZI
MRFSGAIKRIGGSVLLHFDKATKQKFDLAEELAIQAADLDDFYRDTGDLNFLQEALSLIQQALDTVNESQTTEIFESDDFFGDFAHRLVNDFCHVLERLYFATGEVGYLDQCIDKLKSVSFVAPEFSRLRILETCALGRNISFRYFATGEQDINDAREAIDVAYRVLVAVEKGRKKFKLRSEDQVSLDSADELVNKPFERAKGVYFFNRGSGFKRRFFWRGDPQALRSARSSFTEAAKLFPRWHQNHSRACVQLADCEVLYVNRTNDVSGLESALQVINSLDHSTSSSDFFINATHTKSLLYRMRYDHSSNAEDLDRSVAAAKEAAGQSTADKTLRICALQNLSNQLSRVAETQRSKEDMEAAIEAARGALDVGPEEDTQRAGVYAALGAGLEMKYTLFGGPENLKAAIEPLRNAVAVLSEDDHKRAMHLHNLSDGLRYSFQESGKLEQLNESISVERKALRLASKDDAERSVMLHGLSLALKFRFLQTQNSEDLNEAISVSEEALAGTPKESTRYPRRLHDLANVLQDRFARSHDLHDIDRAIEIISEAMSCGSYDETGVLVYSMTLSTCLMSRFNITGEVPDIDRAIAIVRGVLGNGAPSDRERPSWMGQLALLLDKRSESCTDVADEVRNLEEALRVREESVATMPEHHHDMAWFLCDLGSLQMKQVDLPPGGVGRRGQSLKAIASFRRGFNQPSASPMSRIRNGMHAGSLYIILRDWKSSSEILSESIQLFQQVSPLSLDENDRQHQLRGLTGMSTDACVSFIMMGNAEAAIETLEAGRGILANIAMKQHDQLPALRAASPALHARYIDLRRSLSVALPVERIEGVDLVAKRNLDQAAFQAMEYEIQQLPGLDNFNKTLSASQIRQLAEHGPLVSFCTTQDYSFALVITPNSIESLPLRELVWDDIQKKIPLVAGDDRLSLRPPTKRSGANKKMKELLAWLWNSAVKPVLNHLKLLCDVKQSLPPRLWWVTSGPLGLMPLHAAGRGAKFPSENAYAHVVSSYTATLSSLKFARECQSKVSSQSPTVALVTMPQTPNRTDLATAGEAQAVRDAFTSSDSSQQGSGLIELCQPSAPEVLRQVRGGSVDIFHLSCHAEPDLNDPSKTSLLFGSDPTAVSPDPLPIQELRKYNGGTDLSIRAPQLAYLSACCTAQQYELKLLDENIHLAAVFQVMGFPAVIGTLWEADDIAAAFIAKAFYQELFRLGQMDPRDVATIPKEEQIARALHKATAECRAAKFKRTKGAEDALLWANFVHFGP